MGHPWVISKKSLRSLQQPSCRLLILLFTFLTGLWLGSLSRNSSVTPETPCVDVLVDQRSVSEKHATQATGPEAGSSMQKEETTLLVLIMTAKVHKKRREACRSTWLLLGDGRPVRHFFLIGASDVTSMEMADLVTENQTHSDLLVLDQVPDNYAGLTLKLMAAVRLVTQVIDFKFLLKVDDDSFVVLDTLMDELMDAKAEKLYWGYFNGGAPVFKVGTWKETSWFMCDKYLPYAVGGGYLISIDLVQYIVRSADLLQPYNSEDVSLGTWLAPLKITRKHDVRFDTWYKSRGCSNKFLVTHKQSVGQMKDKKQALDILGTLCKKERFVAGYIYDWNALPSQCCTNHESL